MSLSMIGHTSRAFRTLGTGIALALMLVGCGTQAQKSDVPLVPANGTVTLDGQPLADADVQFIPEGDTLGQGGYGRTGQDGTFQASTPFGEAGLATGAYRVVIQKFVSPDGSAFTGSIDPNVPPIEASYREALPPIYSDQDASTLKATVSPDSPKPIDFALKSARSRRKK